MPENMDSWEKLTSSARRASSRVVLPQSSPSVHTPPPGTGLPETIHHGKAAQPPYGSLAAAEAPSPVGTELYCAQPTARSRPRKVSRPAATSADPMASITSRGAAVTSPPGRVGTCVKGERSRTHPGCGART